MFIFLVRKSNDFEGVKNVGFCIVKKSRQLQNSKRKKVNPPVVAPVVEDDEKQQEEEENQNNKSAALEQVESQIEVDNEMVENHDQDEDALSDFEDIFEPKRKENDK